MDIQIENLIELEITEKADELAEIEALKTFAIIKAWIEE